MGSGRDMENVCRVLMGFLYLLVLFFLTFSRRIDRVNPSGRIKKTFLWSYTADASLREAMNRVARGATTGGAGYAGRGSGDSARRLLFFLILPATETFAEKRRQILNILNRSRNSDSRSCRGRGGQASGKQAKQECGCPTGAAREGRALLAGWFHAAHGFLPDSITMMTSSATLPKRAHARTSCPFHARAPEPGAVCQIPSQAEKLFCI